VGQQALVIEAQKSWPGCYHDDEEEAGGYFDY